MTKIRSLTNARSITRSRSPVKASRAPTTSARSSPRSSARWFRVPAGMQTYGRPCSIATSATSAWEPSPPAMPITSAERAASCASARRSSPRSSTTGVIPRFRASLARSNLSTLPPPDFGFISSTAVLPVRAARGPGSRGGACSCLALMPSARQLAAAKTATVTTSTTSSSSAPRRINAAAPPARASTATTIATRRAEPDAGYGHPSGRSRDRGSAARAASSVGALRTTSTTSAATTPPSATSATPAARRPERSAFRSIPAPDTVHLHQKGFETACDLSGPWTLGRAS